MIFFQCQTQAYVYQGGRYRVFLPAINNDFCKGLADTPKLFECGNFHCPIKKVKMFQPHSTHR